ncbi:MAG: copper amine oxidase N-terminal domain-containing protein [Clostridiales Family XIII bacterium]|jgi:outer membrane lipoprotein-sorting protein|nr:copper amine oxidase N-terminal domain-containing protein [Clostridiales Family XIII bacterium]
MSRIINRFGICAAVSLLLILATALFSGFAFAEDAEVGAEVTAADVAADSGAANTLITGEVTKAEKKGDGIVVTLDDGKDGVVLNISELRFVYDQKAKAYASLDDVKEGLTIAAVLPKHAPLSLSSPPQTGAVFGLILNSDAGTSKLDIFDENLLSSDGELKLIIGDDTLIGADTGERRVFTADDLKDKELIVFCDVVYTSLPAQTAPSFVLILTAAPEAEAEPSDASATAVSEAKYVGLRAAAEAKGYTVTWVSNAQPITLSKGDITVTVTIGSDAFTYTHLTKDVQPLDSVEKLDLTTRLVDGKTMVADSFTELLK